jgi:predicted helicase
MNLNQYIESINTRYKSGISREHAYRRDLEELIRELVSGVEITNEPANVTDCGNPDYVITKGKIPVGYIEAKDVGKDLNHKQYKEQFSRYRKALDNLIITDYTWFQFFQNGDLVHEIRIAEITDDGIRPLPENFEQFINLICDFCTFIGQTVKSPKKLAEMMAAKARLLQTILEQAVTADETAQADSSLQDQYHSFKNILIHDLEPKGFADIYAQTLAYGMFAARLHDTTLDDFSRQEAAELIPKTNPFLRRLFGYIAGPDIDDRIKPTVDNLADVFRATNVEQLLKNFGKSTRTNDPIIHFYETFLAEYDPKLRKARGVWYTPEPVVSFIVRAVDELLKTEFGIKDGLADTSKTKIKVEAQGTARTKGKAKGKAIVEEREVHKVQILDPATGTGTFLAEVIKFIYNGKFQAMQGAWSGYVEEHLIPRLNGFELLMASYAMAHLKLDMLLAETGYQPKKEQRFNIYLTNSLEEHHPDTGTLFANWLSTEANEANHIKRDTPVMVVLGNPPYSGESANKGEWIMKLMEDYKKEPGGKEKLKEKTSKWINDDYVKFIRYSQHFIEKNGEGILAFINPHGFLDNPTFRGMRWNLLKTYDKIYTLDLHGNTKKKETCPDGSPDVNVFDIEQGVSINLFVKTGKKKPAELGTVYHFNLYGKREVKYGFLHDHDKPDVSFEKLTPLAPTYFFIPQNLVGRDEYTSAFKLTELLPEFSLGVLSKNDSVTVDLEQSELEKRIERFTSSPEDELRTAYNLKKDSRDWVLSKAIEDLKTNPSEDNFKTLTYRPFDTRWTYFTGKPKGFFAYSQNRIMRNLTKGDNWAIITGRQGKAVGGMTWNLAFITNTISDQNIYYRGGGTVLPLYLYPDSEELALEENQIRKPNLDPDIVAKIAEGLGLEFTNEKEERDGAFAPIDLLDYIYAVLHSPAYREKYKEFLKIDFPRVPYPTDTEKFWQLVQLGGELRQIHLLESPVVEQFITSYPMDGDNTVTRKMTKTSIGYEPTNDETGRVWINDEQYFDNVPLIAWEFYIGGYQPAQKWLKDRNGRTLSFDDILHYQKIIVALSETDRLMQEIDLIGVENE